MLLSENKYDDDDDDSCHLRGGLFYNAPEQATQVMSRLG